MDIQKYKFQGDEFLDRFDGLKAARKTVDEILENGDKSSLNGYVEKLEEAHREMDQLFEEEYLKFPIQTVETDKNGFKTSSISVIETEAESYGEMVEKLEELNMNLSERQPGMDYSEMPSPIAFIDYSEELVEEWYSLQETYRQL